MRPEKRRAGRAIRKARREQREAMEAALPRINEVLSALMESVANGFTAFGEAMKAAADSIRGTVRRNPPSLPPSVTALPPAGPSAGDPSHSGGEALRSALSAWEDDRPFEGIGDD